MLRLIKNELARLITCRFLVGALLVLLCLNLAFAIRYRVDPYIPNRAYRQISADLTQYGAEQGSDALLAYLHEKVEEYSVYLSLARGEAPDAEESGNVAAYIRKYQDQTYELRYTDHVYWELQVYQSQLDQVSSVQGYGQYLEQIRQNAERIQTVSIFADPDSFAYRNSVKAEEAYGRMEGVCPVYDTSYGIVSATDNRITDLSLVACILLITVYLLVGQKSTGLQSIVRSCKNGGFKLVVSQLAALLLVCIVGTAVFTGVNLCVGAVQFGLGDLGRPIQSVEGFLGCTLRVSVLGYLLLFWLEKSLALFAVAAVAAFLCMVAKSDVAVFFSMALVTAVEAILFFTISPLSYLSGLKYLNLASAVQTNGILKKYANIHFFSFPLDMRAATFVTIGAVVLLFASLTVWRYVKRDTPAWSSGKLSEMLNRLNPFKHRISAHIWGHEAYKVLIANKAIWILLAFVLIQFYHYGTYRRPYDLDDAYFQEYTQKVEGLTPQEAWVFVQEEQERFDRVYSDIDKLIQRYASGELTEMQYNAVLASLQSELATERAFSMLTQRLEYLDAHCPSGGVVYDTGYSLLYRLSPQTFDQPILAALFLVLCISPILAYDREKSVCGIIRATRFGRTKARFYQWLYGFVIGAAVMCIAYFPLFLNVSRVYGLGDLSLPVQSLPAFAAFPFSITLGGFLVLVYGLRLLVTWIGVCLLMGVSSRCKSVVASMILGLVATGVPLGIYLAVCLL